MNTALIDQLIRLPDPLPQRPQLAQRSLELGPQRLRRFSSGRIYGQLLAVLLEHRQKAIVIVLVVALQLRLGREVLHFCAQVAFQPAQEAFDLLQLLLVHLQHPLRQEGQQIVHYIRFLLFGDEIDSSIFGQTGVHLGQNFREFAVGLELLQLRPQAGAATARGWPLDLYLEC